MYKDQIKKTAYYTSEAVKSITKDGVYPDPALIEKQLRDIDTRLCIFYYKFRYSGEDFSVSEYNQQYNQIYQDLKILYDCINELSVKEYNAINQYIDTELKDMEIVASDYMKRADMETTNLFGNTIFYKASGFNQQYINGQIIIDIGDIVTHQNANIICMCDGTDIPLENAYFTIESTKLSPYEYNQDQYTVPGLESKKVYTYTRNEIQKLASSFKFNIDSMHHLYAS